MYITDEEIMELNDRSVERVQLKLNLLSQEKLKDLGYEFRNYPDMRFGDNLLVCLSRMAHNKKL